MLSIDDAFARAVALHREGRIEAAARIYEQILSADVAHAAAANALGMVRHQQGRSDEAVTLIERALAQQPSDAAFHNNLGNVHFECGRHAAAIASYRRAVELQPGWAVAVNNLGHACRADGRAAAARACFERALALDAGFARALRNLALLNCDDERYDDAVPCFERVLELDPDDDDTRYHLALTLRRLQRNEAAAEVYRAWLERDPDNPVVHHMAAALAGVAAPERASDGFVEQTFDRFASSFETVLTGRLDYRAPQLCAAALARHGGTPAAQWEVLDAGCGTGLCGPLLAPWAQRLHGVDLSRAMLDAAHAKGVYDELYKAELTRFLELSPAQWQLIVCADTLCYFGRLEPLFTAAAHSLRAPALFVFTVEALPDDDTRGHALQAHGRYAHTASYVTAALHAAGLEPLELCAGTLRLENKVPVGGWIVAARRADAGNDGDTTEPWSLHA